MAEILQSQDWDCFVRFRTPTLRFQQLGGIVFQKKFATVCDLKSGISHSTALGEACRVPFVACHFGHDPGAGGTDAPPSPRGSSISSPQQERLGDERTEAEPRCRRHGDVVFSITWWLSFSFYTLVIPPDAFVMGLTSGGRIAAPARCSRPEMQSAPSPERRRPSCGGRCAAQAARPRLRPSWVRPCRLGHLRDGKMWASAGTTIDRCCVFNNMVAFTPIADFRFSIALPASRSRLQSCLLFSTT